MRLLGILLCLAALGLTAYSALTYKAPTIEAGIERRTVQALSRMAAEDVEVRVDGRQVTLWGRVADGEQRRLVLTAAAAVPGALAPIDRLDRLAVASPYRFVAVRDENGGVTIEGHAPDAGAKAAIENDARALFGSGLNIAIKIAAGAPEGDWPKVAGSAMDALATLRLGRLSVSDTEILLKGEVATEADADAVRLFAAALPDGYRWRQDVAIRRETADPYTFSVVKERDGGLRLVGFAPDEETRAALIEEGQLAAGDQAVIADIAIADGMPDGEWPSLVQAGIGAMKDMEAGRFDVIGSDVSFSSDPEVSEGDPATSAVAVTEAPAAPPDDGPIDAALVSKATPAERRAPALTIDKAETGVWSLRGVVPDQRTQDALAAALDDHAGVEDVDIELDVAGAAPDEDWLHFAADHLRTLDEVSAGQLSLEEYRAHLIGVVETPDEIEPVEAALRAIDGAMTIDLQPIDPRPAASLDLKLSSDEGVTLSGALPGDLSEKEALLALGVRRYGGELGTDARGSADVWRRHLSNIGAVLPAFEEVDLTLGGEQPKIEGRVHAQADPDAITRQIVLALGDDRRPLVDVAASTTVHDDGATRTSPFTGEEETHQGGYWLPVIDIAADEGTCRDRTSSLLDSGKITFLRGEDELDARAGPTLNAIAGLATACLESTGLMLEIGGHTDSRGAARMNRELSQARAEAVREALIARGVDGGSLIAVGYGDQRPVADNATDEGRAANRRTTFEWKTSAQTHDGGNG